MVVAVYSLGALASLPGRWRVLEPDERAVLLGLLVLFLAPLASLVNADDLDSFLKTYERFARFLLIIPVYLMVRGLRLDLWPFLVAGCVLAGPVMAVVAWHDVEILRYPRALGAYHPIVFGDIAVLVSLFLLVWLAATRWSLWHALLVGSLPAALYAAVLTQTRGAWVTLALCLPIVAVAGVSRRGQRIAPVALAALLLSVALVWMAWPTLKHKYDDTLRNYQRWSEGEIAMNSLGNRIEMWKLSLDLWREHPVAGTGAGDFKSHIIEARKDDGAEFILDFDHAHSIYLHYLATTGLIGFIAMLFGLIILPIRFFIRAIGPPGSGAGEPQAWAGVVLVTAFALFGLTETWTVRSPLISLFAILLPVLMASAAGRRPLEDR